MQVKEVSPYLQVHLMMDSGILLRSQETDEEWKSTLTEEWQVLKSIC